MLRERLSRLSTIQLTLRSYGINSLVIDGALLGIIRGGNLIPWDWDSEIAVLENDFDIFKIEKAISFLIQADFRVKSVSSLKYFKVNVYHKDDTHFIFSIFLLRKRGDYYVRPRYKYPVSILQEGGKPLDLEFGQVWIPVNSLDILKHVYGENWRNPIQSRIAKSYLNSEVFRWGKFDWIHRGFWRLRQIVFIFPKFLTSKYFIKREFLFRHLLTLTTNPNCDLLEIGSSDGAESKIFLSNHKTSHSTIYEPRREALNRISNTFKYSKLSKRLAVQPFLVVAEKGDSRHFIVEAQANLSHIAPETLSDHGADFFKEFLVQELFNLLKFRAIIVKMDLEGYEIELIHSLLQSGIPSLPFSFLIELHQDRYDMQKAQVIFNDLLKNGFRIEFIETASHPKPRCLQDFLIEKPSLIAGRRGLWKIKDGCEFDLIEMLYKPYFVYNNLTSQYGYRAVRSVLFSRNISYQETKAGFFTGFWRTFYKLAKQ